MAFTEKNWIDEANHAGPPAAPPGTPISAVALEDLETRLSDYADIQGGPIFNVKDPTYGGTGDGVTDDTGAIQAAHDAADAEGGGVVYIPRGTFMVDSTDPVLLSGSNIFTKGAGPGATTLKVMNAGTAHRAMIIGSVAGPTIYNVGLSDMTIDGSRTSTTRTGDTDQLVYAKYLTGFWLNNLEVKEAGWSAIDIALSYYGFATNIWTHDHNGNGISLNTACEHVHFANITAERTGDDAIAYVTWSEGETRYCTGTNLIAKDGGMNDGTGSQGGSGLKIASADYITISGIVTTGSADGGVHIETSAFGGATPSERISITGIVSVDSGQRAASPNKDGIVISNGASIFVQGESIGSVRNGVRVSNNSSEIDLDLDVLNSGEDGIYVTSCQTVNIRGKASHSDRSGVQIVDSTNVIVDGVQALNNNQGTYALGTGNESGLTAQIGVGGLTVTGGDFTDNQGTATQRAGITIQSGTVDGLTVTGADLRGNIDAAVNHNVAPTNYLYTGNLGHQTNGKNTLWLRDTNVLEASGTGTPQGTVVAGIGSVFRRTDAGTATLYIKETGTGNTGWVGK